MAHITSTSSRSIVRAALAVAAAAGLALTAACAPTADPGSSGEPSPEPSSTTSPSPIDTAPPAEGDAVPIPDDDPRMEEAMSSQEFPIAQWSEPGETMAIFLGGSGSSSCVPSPVSATATSASEIAMVFTPPTGDLVCTADFRIYGWEVPVSGDLDVDAPITVTVTGLTDGGEPSVVTLEP